MPMIMKCDNCGKTTNKNAAKDGVPSTRGNLTVFIKLVKAPGAEPIVCEHCIRKAAYYPEQTVTE